MGFASQLGKRIKELRNKAELSQDQLAEQAGISGKYLGEVERGEVNVSVVILEKLAKVLHLSLPELLLFEHHVPRQNLEAALIAMLRQAEDNDLRMAYRILTAILK